MCATTLPQEGRKGGVGKDTKEHYTHGLLGRVPNPQLVNSRVTASRPQLCYMTEHRTGVILDDVGVALVSEFNLAVGNVWG